MPKPRCYTPDEIREMFLAHCADLVDYWLAESREPSTRGKMEGLVFSILAALDGTSMNLPGFIVAPHPHPTDKQYHKDEGENWFPQNDSDKIKGDIGGILHDNWGKHARRKPRTGDDGTPKLNLKRVLMELGNRLVTEHGYDPVDRVRDVYENTTLPIKELTEFLNAHEAARGILAEMGYDWPVVQQPPQATTEDIREAAERIQPPEDDIPF